MISIIVLPIFPLVAIITRSIVILPILRGSSITCGAVTDTDHPSLLLLLLRTLLRASTMPYSIISDQRSWRLRETFESSMYRVSCKGAAACAVRRWMNRHTCSYLELLSFHSYFFISLLLFFPPFAFFSLKVPRTPAIQSSNTLAVCGCLDLQ